MILICDGQPQYCFPRNGVFIDAGGFDFALCYHQVQVQVITFCCLKNLINLILFEEEKSACTWAAIN